MVKGQFMEIVAATHVHHTDMVPCLETVLGLTQVLVRNLMDTADKQN